MDKPESSQPYRRIPLRRVLHVGTDQHRSGTASVGGVQPLQHRGLLAEVAGELQQRDGLIDMAPLPVTNHSNRGIRRSVINQQKMSTSGKAATRSIKVLITRLR